MDPQKFTEATTKALEGAINLAKESSNSQLAPAHLASALLTPTTQANTGQQQATLFASIINKGELEKNNRRSLPVLSLSLPTSIRVAPPPPCFY